MQGVYSWGPYTCKLHDSIKSITEHKYKLCITDIQSDKVLKKKKKLSSDIVLSHKISTTNQNGVLIALYMKYVTKTNVRL